MEIEHHCVEDLGLLYTAVAEDTQSGEEEPLAIAAGGDIAGQLVHGLRCLVNIVPRQPDFQRHRADAKIAGEVGSLRHGLQFWRGVYLAGPPFYPLGNLFGRALVVIDGLLEKPFHLILRRQGVDFFDVVLGKRRG